MINKSIRPTHNLYETKQLKILKKAMAILLLMILATGSYSQVNDQAIRQIVLKKEIKDSLYIFGKWDGYEGTETHLKYLGILKTKNGQLKIMTSSWIWGNSKRATNRILVFNVENKYLGNFKITMDWDLPKRITKNQLIFVNDDNEDCDKSLVAKISFDNGIPKEFFLRCRKDSGDFYFFDDEIKE